MLKMKRAMIAKIAAGKFIIVILTATGVGVAGVVPAFSQTAPVEKATLADLAFIAGQWRGELQGGVTEENWSPAAGDSMSQPRGYAMTLMGTVIFAGALEGALIGAAVGLVVGIVLVIIKKVRGGDS